MQDHTLPLGQTKQLKTNFTMKTNELKVEYDSMHQRQCDAYEDTVIVAESQHAYVERVRIKLELKYIQQ